MKYRSSPRERYVLRLYPVLRQVPAERRPALLLLALSPLPAGALHARMRSYLSLAAGINPDVGPRAPA